MPKRPTPIAERLNAKLVPEPHETLPTPCLVWSGKTNERGYGYIRDGRRMRRVHRVAYELVHGAVAADALICHRCDNPPCANPEHLFVCTHSENAFDREQKRRGGRTKLTPEDVREIRRQYAAGGITAQKLGRRYGVDHTTVLRAVDCENWRWFECDAA